MSPNPQEAADLVTFTQELLTGKFHFCGVEGELLTGKIHFLWSRRRRKSFPSSNNSLDDVFTLKDLPGLEEITKIYSN